MRERPEFFAEGTASIFQLRQTLQQSCRGYDYNSMVEAEPAIRQLLKLDFEQKVKETVMFTFRSSINQTLNSHLLNAAQDLTDSILQKHEQARIYLSKTLEKEAQEKISVIQNQKDTIEKNIETYNQSVLEINLSLERMLIDRKKFLEIHKTDLALNFISAEIKK